MPIVRNAYFGYPPRAWLRIAARDGNGTKQAFDVVADTGSPFAVVLRGDLFDTLAFDEDKEIESNFGMMIQGWINLLIPELGIDELVRAYRGDAMVASAAKSDPSFVGVFGLPILRLGEYGGDVNSFWFRYPPSNTPSP